MTRQRTFADGRADRTALELVQMARDELALIDTQLRWLQALSDGQARSDHAGSSSSNVASDATGAAAAASAQARHKLARGHARLATLVDKTLPSIAYGLELRSEDPRLDEGPRLADENDPDDLPEDDLAGRAARRDMGPARLDGGVSAYRGDRRVSSSRPDVREALDAQHRRLARGEGYGHG